MWGFILAVRKLEVYIHFSLCLSESYYIKVGVIKGIIDALNKMVMA